MKKMTFGWRSCLRLVGPEGTSVIASGEQFCENVKELVADSGDEREFQFRYVNQSEPASDGMTKWINGYPAAQSLKIIGYRPIDSAQKNLINEASRKVKDGVYMELKGRHFDFALNKKIKDYNNANMLSSKIPISNLAIYTE
eukprot:jgi/Bigna1/137942/aug1.42_g12650